MKNFKRILRLMGLAIIIALACTGICFLGGAPVPEKRRRENLIEYNTEVKQDEGIKDDTTFFYKQQ